MAEYVYKQTEFSPYHLWTVGYYDQADNWYPESDHETAEAAANRVHYLNGGADDAQKTLVDAMNEVLALPIHGSTYLDFTDVNAIIQKAFRTSKVV